MGIATTSGAQQQLDMETKRQSLLDVILGRVADNNGLPLCRLIYVAQSSNADACKAYHTRLLQTHGPGRGELTGILLLYPMCMVHVMEGKTDRLHAVLREVQAASPSESRIQEARIILSMEDVPGRCFTSWQYAFVPSNSSLESADAAETSQVVSLCTELSSNMRKLGASLSGLSEAELHRHLSSIATHHEQQLPAPETLLSLAVTPDVPSLGEYLAIYGTPPEVVLDDEVVWPMQTPLIA